MNFSPDGGGVDELDCVCSEVVAVLVPVVVGVDETMVMPTKAKSTRRRMFRHMADVDGGDDDLDDDLFFMFSPGIRVRDKEHYY